MKKKLLNITYKFAKELNLKLIFLGSSLNENEIKIEKNIYLKDLDIKYNKKILDLKKDLNL